MDVERLIDRCTPQRTRDYLSDNKRCPSWRHSGVTSSVSWPTTRRRLRSTSPFEWRAPIPGHRCLHARVDVIGNDPFLPRRHDELRPRCWDWRSTSTVRSHVRLGRHVRRRQSARGGLLVAWRTRGMIPAMGRLLKQVRNTRDRLVVIAKEIRGLTSFHFFAAVQLDTGGMHRHVDWTGDGGHIPRVRWSMCTLHKGRALVCRLTDDRQMFHASSADSNLPQISDSLTLGALQGRQIYIFIHHQTVATDTIKNRK